MKLTKRDKEFGKRLDCKLWNQCEDKTCLREAKRGSTIWSKKVCYALKELIDKGEIEIIKLEE